MTDQLSTNLQSIAECANCIKADYELIETTPFNVRDVDLHVLMHEQIKKDLYAMEKKTYELTVLTKKKLEEVSASMRPYAWIINVVEDDNIRIRNKFDNYIIDNEFNIHYDNEDIIVKAIHAFHKHETSESLEPFSLSIGYEIGRYQFVKGFKNSPLNNRSTEELEVADPQLFVKLMFQDGKYWLRKVGLYNKETKFEIAKECVGDLLALILQKLKEKKEWERFWAEQHGV